MYDNLKIKVCKANIKLHDEGLAPFTWGNVSAVDRHNSVFAIKPSGVPYSELSPEKIVIISLKDGSVIDGELNPSSDTPTHFVLYNAFPEIGAVVHTHSVNACAWAQAGREIPPYGTTHADFSYTAIPCTRNLTKDEVDEAYELNTGKVIVEHFREYSFNPVSTPAVLVQSHAPFIFGKNADDAVNNAAVLEIVAEMALKTEKLSGTKKQRLSTYLSDKHYFRKHGENAYYGQKKL